jgi:glycosyltransferase involved in cell wall biosynthesis
MGPTVTLFDARSATLARSTGWERCARELANSFAKSTEVIVRRGKNSTSLGVILDGEYALPKEVQKHRLVHFPTFPPTLRAQRFARNSLTQIVWTLHDLTWWKSPNLSSFLGQNYYRSIGTQTVDRAHIVTPSESVRTEVSEFFNIDLDKITAIPNGISQAFIDAARQAESSDDKRRATNARPYLLFVGTIEPRKNLRCTLQAFALSGLAKTHDFWLVGRKAWGALPEAATPKGVLNDQELVRAYQGAAATVLLSLDEGFGLPVVESLACKTRVLASKIPVFEGMRKELLSNGGEDEAILLADPLSMDEMADAMKQAVSLEGLANKSACEWAAGFTWQRSSNAHLDLYRKLIN